MIECESHEPSVIKMKAKRSKCKMRIRGVQRNEEVIGKYSERERKNLLKNLMMRCVKSALHHFIQ